MARPSELIDQRLDPFSQGDPVIASWLRATIGRIMERDGFTDVEILDVPEDDIRHVADWFVAARLAEVPWTAKVGPNGVPPKLMKFGSIEAIVREADRATVVLAQKGRSVVLVSEDEEVVATLKDGATVVRLLTPAALDREGAAMGHCIGGGGYDRSLREGGIYLSVRDARNRPHVTMQIVAGELRQFQGKQNRAPNSRWAVISLPYVLGQNWSLGRVDLSRMGLVALDTGQVVPVPEIPPGSKVLGRLSIDGKDMIDLLPRDLAVDGNLQLTASASEKIVVLPVGLRVGGSLVLTGLVDWRLPEGLVVEGDLVVENSSTSALPEGIVVGGDLSAAGTAIEILPSLFEVRGSIDLSKSGIRRLPPRLWVNGSLLLQGVSLEELPDGIDVGRDLDVSDAEIGDIGRGISVGRDLIARKMSGVREMPEIDVGRHVVLSGSSVTSIGSTVARGDLDIDGTGFTTLPDGMSVGGNLNAGRSGIAILGRRIVVGGRLDLSGCPLATVPEDVSIGGSLDLTGSSVVGLPVGLQVGGTLDVSDTPLRNLPRGLSVGGHLRAMYLETVSLPDDLQVEGNVYLVGTRVDVVPDTLPPGKAFLLSNGWYVRTELSGDLRSGSIADLERRVARWMAELWRRIVRRA